MAISFEKAVPILRNKVDQRITEILSSELSKMKVESMNYTSMLCSGKKLRPILLLLIVKSLGKDEDEALDAAVGVELIHNSTLVLDDIIDGATVRRGFPTLHQVCGVGVAISVGLFLASKGMQLLTEYDNHEIDEATAKALVQLSQGEMLDAFLKGGMDASRYLTLNRLKSGALFGLSSAVGAILGGCSKSEVRELWRYGILLGTSYQLLDDLSDSDAPLLTYTHNFTDEALFVNYFSGIMDTEKLKEYLQGNGVGSNESRSFGEKLLLCFLDEAKRALGNVNRRELLQCLLEFTEALTQNTQRLRR